MAKTKKEELIEGVDAPSVDPVVSEDVTEVVTMETVAKSLLDEAEAKIAELENRLYINVDWFANLFVMTGLDTVTNKFEDDILLFKNRVKDLVDSEEEKEDLKELLEQAHEKIEALQGGPTTEVEKAEPLSFEFEGEQYQFSEEAPALILINGTGVTQTEIIEDEELVLQLIGGNSGLILKK